MPAKPPKMNRLAAIAIVLVAALISARFGVDLLGSGEGDGGAHATASSESVPALPAVVAERPRAGSSAAVADDADVVLRAMREQESGIMVTLVAEVVAVLPDDNEGSRHQRFLLGFEEPGAPYDSVLVAHNIDLAPRVPAEEGDVILVRGQYEWNDRGGVLHWTHHDPKDWREGGWIEFDGERYE